MFTNSYRLIPVVLAFALGCGGIEPAEPSEFLELPGVSNRKQASSGGCVLSADKTSVNSGDIVRLSWDWPDTSQCKPGTITCYRSASNCNVSEPFCDWHRGQWSSHSSTTKGSLDMVTKYEDSSPYVSNYRVYAPNFDCGCVRMDGSPIGCGRQEQWISVGIKRP